MVLNNDHQIIFQSKIRVIETYLHITVTILLKKLPNSAVMIQDKKGKRVRQSSRFF